MSGLTGNILITGGSGTLGHAIVRTAEAEGWDCTFTIYSRSELRQAQMRAKHPHLRYVIGDVRDADRLTAAIVGHDTVIHAAALKRIPECEAQPTECYWTNVFGSMNVVRACIAGGVERCVGISTDKACASITTYGASKRLMEGLFQASGGQYTIFTLARYGNIVASNGSVIPIWKQQAAEGKPLTVTSRAMTRFWMAESDAVRTIGRALTMPHGTITVPKMSALSIEAMAHIIAPDAKLAEVGLRSREKLHEDLIHRDECAIDNAKLYYTLTPGPEGSGIGYTSDTAPRLSREQFLAMLEEAATYDG
jgi:UDP-N-acetylglucosamine 4,6-dehydratase